MTESGVTNQSTDEGMDPEEPTLTNDEYSTAQKDVADKNLLEQTVSLQNAIFNSANFVSVATDAKGVIQIFNVGAQRMLGYTADEVVNKVVPGIMHDPAEIAARAAKLSADFGKTIQPGFETMVYKASRGIEDVYELTAIRKDGSRFPTTVSVSALRDSDAEIIGYLLISTDNTARYQAALAQSALDQKLRDQQFYTRSLIESNIDALMMTDTNGIISDVNQQTIELTGRTRDELIGAPCRNFFVDPVRADTAIKRALNEGRVSDYELTVRALNGDDTDVSYNAATFYDRDRVVQGVFASARDVTERKRFERALQKTNIELERANRMKTEFLATMSHELRTPLNAIIGFSEALKEGFAGDLTESQREYTGDIHSSGLHLLSLINDILDLSKVEAGMVDIELEPVDVRFLLEESLTIVRDTAALHSLQLTFKAADCVGTPLLDRRKVKQIVYNLLANAVKFTPDHGDVTLSAKRVARNAVGTIDGSRPVHDFPLPKSDVDTFLEIRVDDTGIGISPENLSKLFLAFSQIDSSLARRFEGTGLGLATVKQLVEIQGGTVAVASEEGVGSSFVVWLPLGPTDDQAPEWSGAGIKILESDAVLTGRETSGPAPTLPVARNTPRLDSTPGGAPSAVEDGQAIVAGEVVRPHNAAPNGDYNDVQVRSGASDEDRNPPQAPPIDDRAVASADATSIKPDSDTRARSTDSPDSKPTRPPSRSRQQTAEDDNTPEQHVALVIDDDAEGAQMLQVLLEAEDFRVIVAGTGKEGLEISRTQQLSVITLDVRLTGADGWGFLLRLHEYSEFAAVPIVLIAGNGDVSLALTHGAAAVLEKPISQEALQQALEALGLSPDARRTRRVLVADDDPETVEVIAQYLTRPEYVIESASSKEDSIEMALRLRPDLILLNLMMEEFSGYQVLLALQHDSTTEHIPVLVVTGKALTHQETAAVDSDPSQPVSVIGANRFNRHAFLDEVRRALSAGARRSRN
ncbi:hybrid sensor histidine kinase/response regulator [Cryobacterium luteum]|uniref:histidine kinase n=1 Tax=Cryobacterium luteum TaxID=1424661 RepID=A0A1H8E320_9MICO|nr:hybrid sensor histidine kinase/response regulator [Cryobacterium luteum]TFB89798.1 hybrid sensor histidine kinase/response regulator [Cryobacterium luteum]SEN13981.1 PAS domain S-box-containing protein [Cryobacterium luteum]